MHPPSAPARLRGGESACSRRVNQGYGVATLPPASASPRDGVALYGVKTPEIAVAVAIVGDTLFGDVIAPELCAVTRTK